ncbi:MAG: riboflavin biosynthesis protein RibF, partial [Muribaculaceae bacterium]|nr:riboflavin biosynthesis protein RibF [Muribaculaceae bacterium]
GRMSGKVAAIGTFDGVHAGHAVVLSEVMEEARRNGLEPLAITFDRHPLALISPQRAPLAITTIEKKTELIAKTGVTPIVLPFDEKLRSTTARDWMRMIHSQFGVEHIVVGYDNTFGCDGVALSLSDYRRIGEETGITVSEAPMLPGVSSSAIRKAIAAGDIDEANRMLGRRFAIPGIVVEGNKLGRTIGFPTANMMPHPGIVVPGNGVYAAVAYLPGGTRRDAVVNIGVRPTVRRGNNLTIEAHIIDWSGDLYGHQFNLVFHTRMREEIRFNSIDALKRQIEKDTSNAKLFLSDATKQIK